MAESCFKSAGSLATGQLLGPSHRALSGSGWHSMKMPSTPAPAAATGQCGHVMPFTAGAAALPSGKLDGMRRVEDHRDAQCPHNRYGTEVDHEVIVSERGAPFRQKDAVIASRGHFIAHGAHIPREPQTGLS